MPNRDRKEASEGFQSRFGRFLTVAVRSKSEAGVRTDSETRIGLQSPTVYPSRVNPKGFA